MKRILLKRDGKDEELDMACERSIGVSWPHAGRALRANLQICLKRFGQAFRRVFSVFHILIWESHNWFVWVRNWQSILVCLGNSIVPDTRAESRTCQHHPHERKVQDGHEEGVEEAAETERLFPTEHGESFSRRMAYQAGWCSEANRNCKQTPQPMCFAMLICFTVHLKHSGPHLQGYSLIF